MARPRSDIEPRLIAAARKRFLSDGIDGASLRAIAKDAGTNVGMVHYYFETKENLFFEVIEEQYANFLRDLTAIFESEGTFFERVERVSVRVSALSDEELDVMRLVLAVAIGNASERRKRLLERFAEGHLAVISRAALGAAAAGELDPALPLPVVMITTFGSMVIPQFMLRLMSDARPPPLNAMPEPAALAKLLRRALEAGVRVHSAE